MPGSALKPSIHQLNSLQSPLGGRNYCAHLPVEAQRGKVIFLRPRSFPRAVPDYETPIPVSLITKSWNETYFLRPEAHLEEPQGHPGKDLLTDQSPQNRSVLHFGGRGQSRNPGVSELEGTLAINLTTSFLIGQTEKPRLREEKGLAQGYLASRSQAWTVPQDSTPAGLCYVQKVTVPRSFSISGPRRALNMATNARFFCQTRAAD